MKILFVGVNRGNSKNTYTSLKKVYPKTELLDTSRILNKLKHKIFYHASPDFFNKSINNFYKKNVNKFYDLAFFMNVEYINDRSLETIKKFCNKTIFYCADNPFVTRDKYIWTLVKRIISKFDLVLFHQSRREYVKKYKIKNYLTILPPYFKNIQQINSNNFKKNIVFVGTWFPERKFFMNLKRGLSWYIWIRVE